MEQRKKEGYF